MELEQTANQLKILAGKGSLTAADHERARALMKELRKMGMTNAHISEFTGQRWAETTVKEYTRGVKAVDPQAWQSAMVLFGEVASKGITTGDMKETLAVRDELESGGTSFTEITELLTELKKAGIGVGGLVALYRECKESGLTALGVASALKYKGEIEEMGFGLDSLSDMAGAARALGKPKDVLGAIVKYRDISELDNQLEAAQGRLADEETRIKERIEAGEQAIRKVEERQKNALDRLGKLDQEVGARAELLTKAEEVEKLGLDRARLSDLCTAVIGAGAKHGLGRKEAVQKFFDELKEYDAALGFQAEAKRWGTIAETKKLDAGKWQAEADSLSRRHKDLSEAIAAVQSLIKHGVNIEQIVSWSGIVSKLGGPEELQDKLGQYKSMSELLAARKREMEDCNKKVKELSAQIKALNEQKVEIEGAIKSLSTSGVKEIIEVSEKAVTGLKSLSTSVVKEVTKVSGQAITEVKSILAEIRAETKRLADLKAEAGKLEKELMYARYFITGDQAVVKSFPKEVVIAFLDKALVYCKLNQLNPTVRVPDSFPGKYHSVYSSTEVGLLDLIAWAEAGLVGASQ